MSETLAILKVTENQLHDTILALLEKKSYLKTAMKISKALRDAPMTPIEEATYWTEWVIRNPDIDLEGPAGKQSFITRHSLDVIFVIMMTLLIILYVGVKIIILLIKLFSFLFTNKEKSNPISNVRAKKRN